MEVGDGDDGKTPPEAGKKAAAAGAAAAEGGEKPPKRKMKSPYQLEVLEKTYASLCFRLFFARLLFLLRSVWDFCC